MLNGNFGDDVVMSWPSHAPNATVCLKRPLRDDGQRSSVPPSRSNMPLPSPPPASSPAVRAVMVGNRAHDTRPEVALRSALHRLGLRFRKHAKPLDGLRCRADVVFRPARVAVFV